MSRKKSARKGPEETREGEIILYTSPDGAAKVEVFFQEETLWLNINRMADLFGTTKQVVSYHLQQIYESEELQREATVKEILTVQQEGEREVSRKLDFYNLDAIIAVGYRVNSRQATQFRIWATQVLREFIIKGNQSTGAHRDHVSRLRGKPSGAADSDENERLGGEAGRFFEVQRI